MELINVLRWMNNASEILACITGFIMWQKVKNTFWKWFPFYLLIIVALELTGKYLAWQNLWQQNIFLYMYFGIPFQILFYLWLMKKILDQYKSSVLPLVFAVVYIILRLADEWLLAGKSFVFKSLSFCAGNGMLLVLLFIYFINLANSADILRIRSIMAFWVCCGLVTYQVVSLPFYAMYNLLAVKYPGTFYIYTPVVLLLSVFMYVFFIIGFIWSKPNLTFSS